LLETVTEKKHVLSGRKCFYAWCVIQQESLEIFPDIDGSWHLLFPLLSSLLFVLGAMFAKQSALRGTSPFTNTALSNLTLALVWMTVGLVRGEGLPIIAWGPAAAIAFAFFLGQLCTYLAFQFGDVSLATPIFGVKIIIVAFLSVFFAEKAITASIWTAAVLAAIGIGVVQVGSGTSTKHPLTAGRATLTVILAVLAATALSLFDIGLQHYGRTYGAERFLTVMFVFTGVISCGLLPWVDRPARILQIQAAWPLAMATLLMAAQAISISYALGRFGDATRVNIVYSLRGLWSVLLAWLLGRLAVNPEGKLSSRTLLFRLIGAILLLISVVVALSGD
jgi:drug/metabolite transporter (DMT)-like permease